MPAADQYVFIRIMSFRFLGFSLLINRGQTMSRFYFQIVGVLFFVVPAYAEQFGPLNLDGGHITCKSPSGDEIKKYQAYHAPEDRFFKEGSIVVKKISGWAPKENKCELTSVEKKPIKVKTDYGEIDVSVISGFTVFAGADCGTNVANYVGKTASIECEVSADMVKYTNK